MILFWNFYFQECEGEGEDGESSSDEYDDSDVGGDENDEVSTAFVMVLFCFSFIYKVFMFFILASLEALL